MMGRGLEGEAGGIILFLSSHVLIKVLCAYILSGNKTVLFLCSNFQLTINNASTSYKKESDTRCGQRSTRPSFGIVDNGQDSPCPVEDHITFRDCLLNRHNGHEHGFCIFEQAAGSHAKDPN
ncbi:hypothetical protein DPMN_066143 [Dreissena polymorpha]|uniref:Uncharacterized protein n=1 Tax=Dreissena polymorpha TaxID=45954 RepID=A0A9D3YYE9_DREPO|nr:hypothetical protein DPMN_066143 [Dreissena polymorpha]